MKKLGVLVLILALGLPAYSQVLVYTVSFNFRGVIGPELGGTDSEATRERFRGYLVSDLGLTGANPNMTLIMYKKDDTGNKVYEEMVLHVDGFYPVQTRRQRYGCALGIRYGEEETWAILTGGFGLMKVGDDNPQFVARFLRGYIIIRGDMPLTDDEAYGSGMIMAWLNTRLTRVYNRRELPFLRAVREIIEDLEYKGFEQFQSAID